MGPGIYLHLLEVFFYSLLKQTKQDLGSISELASPIHFLGSACHGEISFVFDHTIFEGGGQRLLCLVLNGNTLGGVRWIPGE